MRTRNKPSTPPAKPLREQALTMPLGLAAALAGVLLLAGFDGTVSAAKLVNANQIILVSDDIRNTTTEVVHNTQSQDPSSTPASNSASAETTAPSGPKSNPNANAKNAKNESKKEKKKKEKKKKKKKDRQKKR